MGWSKCHIVEMNQFLGKKILNMVLLTAIILAVDISVVRGTQTSLCIICSSGVFLEYFCDYNRWCRKERFRWFDRPGPLSLAVQSDTKIRQGNGRHITEKVTIKCVKVVIFDIRCKVFSRMQDWGFTILFLVVVAFMWVTKMSADAIFSERRGHLRTEKASKLLVAGVYPYLPLSQSFWLLLHATTKNRTTSLTSIIQKRRLMLFGHLIRMDESADARRILTAVPQSDWRRPVGRPHSSWMATLKNDLPLHNLTFEDAIEMALDKPL